MRPSCPRALWLLVLLCCAPLANAASVVDHEWHYDNSGIWNRHYQLRLIDGMIVGEMVGALSLGAESRLGLTFWRAIDSSVFGAVSSEVLKNVVQRPRPTQSSDSDEIRQGKGHYSFPSGEVTAVTAIVTPFVLEYGGTYPAVYALEGLPLYDAIARLKSNAHWQSDVLAGFAIGSFTGYRAQARASPFFVGILPHGLSAGFRTSF